MVTKLALIAIGGALGTLCRYGLHEAGVALFGRTTSVGVLVANVLGCLLLGFIATFAVERADAMSEDLRLALTIGFLGGLTTFSTFAYDTMAHAQDGRWSHAGVHIALHVVLGLGAAVLGWWIATRVAGGALPD
ncbi:MAG: fluoride efflux transporter CrcB [Planctomycetota bacterium]